MTEVSRSEGTAGTPATTGDRAVNKEVPFSLAWLNAVDPPTFTPYTWANGRETNIRLRAADGSIRVNVYRVISHYLDGEVELKDEVYALKPGGTESGDQDVSQFKYAFDTKLNLTGFDPTPNLTDRMQDVVSALSGMVAIPGSTISASNYKAGVESDFVSDGMKWIEVRTGIAAPTPRAITAGRLALGPSPGS